MKFRGDRLSTHSDTDDDAHLLASYNSIDPEPRNQTERERKRSVSPLRSLLFPWKSIAWLSLGLIHSNGAQNMVVDGASTIWLTQSSSLLPPWLPVRFTNEAATTSTRRDRCKAWVGMGWLAGWIELFLLLVHWITTASPVGYYWGRFNRFRRLFFCAGLGYGLRTTEWRSLQVNVK